MVNILLVIVTILAITALVITIEHVYASDIGLIGIADVGCKDAAKKNINNMGATGLPVLGEGDYRYGCSSSSTLKLWNVVAVKHGTYGNHDEESSTSIKFIKDLMGLGPNGWFSWKITNAEKTAAIAIIGINQYKDFDEGSAQHDYILQKSDQFCGRSDITWVIYAFHEPYKTPTVGGGHGPDKDTRDVIGPIVKECQNKNENVLVLEGHNHIVAFGNIDSVNHAICGGGGEDKDTVDQSKLNGFEYASAKMGYCKFSFGDTTAVVQHIGTDNRILKEFPFYN